MLIATHEMGFARDIADRVCFLDGGVILEQGEPERIFTAPAEPRTRQFLDRIIEAEAPWQAYTSRVLEETTRDVTLEPLDDWIVVEPLDDSETASGLIVPINEGVQTRQAIVAAVGPDGDDRPGRQGALPARRRLRVRLARSAHRVRVLKREGPARPHPRLKRFLPSGRGPTLQDLARSGSARDPDLCASEEGAIRRMGSSSRLAEVVAPPPRASNLCRHPGRPPPPRHPSTS